MPYLLLVGYTDLEIDAADAAAFFNLCLALHCSPKRVRYDGENGRTVCRFSTPFARKLQKKAANGGLSVRVTEEGGLPLLWRRVIKAPALAAGILLALALLVAGRLVLWDIEVAVEGELDVAELEAALAQAGLSRGVFLPSLDSDAVALALRQQDSRLAFVSVNLTGTVAEVQVRVRVADPPEAPTSPANLIAACDGVITLPLAFEGECVVSEGEAVRAGQLLVSGVLESDNNGIRFSRAAGQIFAKTEQELEVFVPFLQQEKQYTGVTRYEISVNFFGRVRKVFKNSGNVSNTCDIIKSDRIFTVGDRVLPLRLCVSTCEAYEWQTVRRTVPEALCEAREALAEALIAATGDGTLLSYTVTTAVEAQGVRLTAVAVVERDIAEVVEFSVG